jgi:hypothetical protein
MSEGIRNHNKFAGLDGIRIITDAISTKPTSINQIKDYCVSRSLDIALSFDATLILLSYIEIIDVDEDKKTITRKQAIAEKDLTERILQLLIEKMIVDGSIQDLFNPLGVKYDVVSDKIAVRNSSISLSLSGIKKLLISIGFFEKSGLSENLLPIDPGHADFFKEIILPVIMPEEMTEQEGMSLEELRSILEQKQFYGKAAEEFVLQYEKIRLTCHKNIDKIKIISEIDCGAGYDIVSFDNMESAEINRFIEVKSYAGKAQFYWSKNEVEEAQARGNAYFLYLVDRNKTSDTSYMPNIIQAPFKNVFLDESIWSREPQSWRFFQK